MCGTNQSKSKASQFGEFNPDNLFWDEYRIPSAYGLKHQHMVYSQFYDDGFRMFNLYDAVDKSGNPIQEVLYYPKWGEYLIDCKPRTDDEYSGKSLLSRLFFYISIKSSRFTILFFG